VHSLCSVQELVTSLTITQSYFVLLLAWLELFVLLSQDHTKRCRPQDRSQWLLGRWRLIEVWHFHFLCLVKGGEVHGIPLWCCHVPCEVRDHAWLIVLDHGLWFLVSMLLLRRDETLAVILLLFGGVKFILTSLRCFSSLLIIIVICLAYSSFLPVRSPAVLPSLVGKWACFDCCLCLWLGFWRSQRDDVSSSSLIWRQRVLELCV